MNIYRAASGSILSTIGQQLTILLKWLMFLNLLSILHCAFAVDIWLYLVDIFCGGLWSIFKTPLAALYIQWIVAFLIILVDLDVHQIVGNHYFDHHQTSRGSSVRLL